MRKFRNGIFIGLLALLFLEIWLGFPIKLENPDSMMPVTSSSDETVTNEAQQKMKGVHLVEGSKGERDWELFADAAEGFEGKGKWRIQKVRIQFYSENEAKFTVTGDSGEIDAKTKDMKIEGNVKTVSVNGYRFESPLLLYMAGPRLLQSPGPVKMMAPGDAEGEGLVLTSNFMRAFVAQSEMSLEGNVHAQKRFKTGRNFSIRSQNAQFSGQHYQARFRDNVVIQYDSMKLESPEASFQYRSSSSLLELVQLRGGVKINDLDKYATSEQVQIEPETNRIILTGKPRVVQGQDELMGEQIVFIDGGKKVKIEKMRARVEKGNEGR